MFSNTIHNGNTLFYVYSNSIETLTKPTNPICTLIYPIIGFAPTVIGNRLISNASPHKYPQTIRQTQPTNKPYIFIYLLNFNPLPIHTFSLRHSPPPRALKRTQYGAAQHQLGNNNFPKSRIPLPPTKLRQP